MPRLLAERFARGVRVEADVLHNMIELGVERARYLANAFRTTMDGKGDWIDSSDQAPAEAWDEVINRHLLSARWLSIRKRGDRQ